MAQRTTKWQMRITLLLAVLILIPSGYGFVGKFIELIRVYQGEADGAFAVAPMMNYLFASLGFAWQTGYAPPTCISQFSVAGFRLEHNTAWVPRVINTWRTRSLT